MTIELPPYPASAGPIAARQLRHTAPKSGSAARLLKAELEKLEDAAAEVFEQEDERTRTRDRLLELADSRRLIRKSRP